MKFSPVYQFNAKVNQWIIHQTDASIPSPDSFKILTFNVLFDTWWGKPHKDHIICSLERFKHQFNVFKELDADLIALNEVTPNYIHRIIQEKWVQDSYYISDSSGATINNFGNLILSKFPIKELSFVTLPQLKRPVPCAKIHFKNQPLIIAATHLSAQKENIERRQLQINELTHFLHQYYPKEDKIILGDLNYHIEQEIVPKAYQDAWESIHSNKKGYTFDGTINTMIHEMWPLAWVYGFKDDVQMRLDRILTQLYHWQPSTIDVCLNTPIYKAQSTPNIIKDIISTIFDRFKLNLARSPKHYLFPSDHFGLIATFTALNPPPTKT
ncbi:endonuclease/exonuclease/phosphatase family protein [Aureispira anguillae]|uniref:Endonuclease/exonuclease/phosphatase family protein n=1 Tax=Aureispira anguillae TaxID=2864201 RepID=A0A915YE31_9BACT|nr:endonuclease/exonuclease/phosphatase family protein [Aureispira anguillae]BDS11359.1 endonuclease/exonuclease/phosphatase family protein [Aureispira anguillae]